MTGVSGFEIESGSICLIAVGGRAMGRTEFASGRKA